MTEYWIVPSNIKHFDIIHHFENHDIVIWRNSFTMKVGDYAYIYIASPYSEVKYKCVVVESEIDEELLKQHPYAIVKKKTNNYFSKKIKYMKLQLIGSFPEKLLSLNVLQTLGNGQVQIQARVSRKLRAFLEECDEKIIMREERLENEH